MLLLTTFGCCRNCDVHHDGIQPSTAWLMTGATEQYVWLSSCASTSQQSRLGYLSDSHLFGTLKDNMMDQHYENDALALRAVRMW